MMKSDLIIIFLGCLLSVFQESLQTSLEANVTTFDNLTEDPLSANVTIATTTPKPKTLEDFIMLTFTEMVLLRQKTRMRPMGYFMNKYLIFEDGNQTQYLVPIERHIEKEEEIKGKLKNHTGEGEICVAGVCLSVEDTRKKLADLEALRLGRIMPSQYTRFAIMTTIMCLVIITGLAGNISIVVSALKQSKLRNTTSVLLCSLAVADILVVGICLPLQIVKQFVLYAYMNVHACRLLYFVRHFSVVSSTLTMAAMAVDRYIAVCHPLKARSYCTVKKARYIVVLTLVLSLAISSPIVWFVNMTGAFEEKFCIFSFANFPQEIAYHVVMLVLVLVIPLCTMVPTYFKIFCVLWRSTSEAKALQSVKREENGEVPKNKGENESIKSRLQVIRLLVVVLLVYTFCWGPPTVLGAFLVLKYELFGIKGVLVHPNVVMVLDTIALCNSFFNPLIYFCMSRRFRQFVLSPCMKAVGSGMSTSSVSSQVKTLSQSMSQMPEPTTK